MNDLRALHLIHSTIKYYQTLGVSPEIRDELLTVASRAIGTKPKTLSAATNDIEIAIAKLNGRGQAAPGGPSPMSRWEVNRTRKYKHVR